MGWKRKRYGTRRKRVYKRRFIKRRGFRRYRRTGRRSGRVLHIKRAANVTVVTTTAGSVEYNGAAQFALSDTFNVSEFTSLFDQYRLNCVLLKFIPDYQLENTQTGGNIQNVPHLHWVIDSTDATVEPVASLVQYQRYHVTRFNRIVTIKLYPRFSMEIYKSPTNTSYGMGSRKVWLDCTSSGAGVPHYGIKFAVDNMQFGASQVVNFKIRPIYYFSLRTSK